MKCWLSGRAVITGANRLWVVLLLLLPTCALAQKARFEFYTVVDGLGGNAVRGVTQDSRGFIWLLNENDLFRFDGRKFLPYSLPADAVAPGEPILGLASYQDSLLFIVTRRKIILLDPRDGEMESFAVPGIDGKSAYLNYIVQTAPDDMLIYTVGDEDYGQKAFWNFRKKHFERIDLPWERSWEHLRFFVVSDAASQTCLFIPGAMRVYNKAGSISPECPVPSRYGGTTTRAAFDANGNLVVLADAVFFTWYSGQNCLEHHPVNRFLKRVELPLTFFALEENGSIWACGENKSLAYYDAARDTFFDFSRELEALIPHVCNFHGLLQDKSGVVWVSTQLGLLKVVPRAGSFDTYFAGRGPDNNFYSFRGLTEDDNGIVYGSYYTGGAMIDLEEKRAYPNAFPIPNLPFGLYAEPEHLFLNTGQVWHRGSRTLDAIPGSISGEDGGVFTKDKSGILYRSYHRSLYRLERSSGTMAWKEVQHLPEGGLWTSDALHAGAKSGLIWIGKGEQLLAWSPETKALRQFGPDELGARCTRIMAIEENKEGKLWLGTNAGLIFFDPADGNKRSYTVKDGLPNDYICGMLAEGDSCLWLGTNHGLSRFRIQDASFTNFFVEDGLTDNEFNRVSYLKARNGRMFFGGIRGVNAFFPQDVMDNYRRRNEASRMVLSAVERTDERRDTILRAYHFSSNPEIHLYHWEHAFTFEYALTDYMNPDEVHYSYRMEGYDDTWSAPSRFNFTRYSGLPSGEYVFRVRARDSRGMWHPDELAVKVVVHAPWWATWWAYALYAGLLALLVYSVMRYEMNRQRLKHSLDLEKLEAERLKELDSFKTRLYTNLTHEFRTPLTVILGMAGQISDRPEARLIEDNGKNLLHLINQLLDLSRLENNAFQLHLRQADIVPYLQYVTESFQTYANSRNLSLRFFSPVESLVMDYDPEQVMHVLVNLISNAVKYTPSGGEVSVRLAPEPGYLGIEVRDTGIGIAADDLPHIFDRFYQVDSSPTRPGEGTGIGLAHTHELVKLMEGTVSVRSTPEEGSVFLVRLPVRHEAPPLEQPIEVEEYRSAEPAAQTLESTVPTASADLPQLLLIEDNADVVTYLRSILGDRFQLDVAYNGSIGVEKALEQVPDIIISDVMMPGMDGFQVCDILKQDDRTSHIPLVLLTARADAASRIAGLRRGADAYLSKPFNKEELLVQLDMLLERQRRMVSWFSRTVRVSDPDSANETALAEAIQVEDAFMQKVRAVIEARYADEDFALPQLCREIGMSRAQLFRKMRALANVSPSDFIRSYRMQKARELLQITEMNVSEVAWKVGYKDPSHFTKSYQEEFGRPPSATKE